MKQLTVLVCLLFMSVFSSSAFGQNGPVFVYKTESTKPEKQKRYWKFSSEFTATNKVETDNKVELFENSVTAYKSTFTNSDERKEFTLESAVGFPMSNSFDNHYLNFRIEAKRKFENKFSITADSQFAFTRFKSFGRVGIGTEKIFGNENKSIKPFSKVDFYFPLDNQISYEGFGHRGVSWSNGIVSEVGFTNFVFQNKSQLILDSGGIIPGKRTLFNTEVSFGYRFNRLCVGPILGYTRLLNGQFPQRNSIVAGMFVRYQ